MATINIFGEIGWDVLASDVIESIQTNKDDEINIIISSGGGSAFEGLMIYDALKASGKKVNTKILGLGASAASVIFMAGENREMGEGSLLMVHNSWSMFMGNKEEVESQLGTLDAIDNRMLNIFMNSTGLPEDKLKQLLSDETFMGADESIELGFATSKAESIKIAASINNHYKKKHKEPVKMATEEETKEAGFLAHMKAWFTKDEPHAEAKAEDKEVKEEAKAMEEDEEKEPKSMDEDKEETKAMDEGEDKPEEEAKAEDKEEEDLKAKVVALEAELAEAKASAAKSDVASKQETEKATMILNAVGEHKFTTHEAKELASKSLDDVKAACDGTPVNASGAGKTERPTQSSTDNKYDAWMSLKSEGKHTEAQAYYKNNRTEILKDK